MCNAGQVFEFVIEWLSALGLVAALFAVVDIASEVRRK
jgi:hypothetical protein